MVINGRVRQSCSALVDRLLEDRSDEIELQPMTKFPVIRDLMVDRSRLFRSLQRVKAWVPVDSYYDMGAGPRINRELQEQNYPLSQCMSCGCCLDACRNSSKSRSSAIRAKRKKPSKRDAMPPTTRDSWELMRFPKPCFSMLIQRQEFGERAIGGTDATRWHSGMWQCSKLCGGMPERDSAYHFDRTSWSSCYGVLDSQIL